MSKDRTILVDGLFIFPICAIPPIAFEAALAKCILNAYRQFSKLDSNQINIWVNILMSYLGQKKVALGLIFCSCLCNINITNSHHIGVDKIFSHSIL